MAKPGINLNHIKNKGYLHSNPWTLVVGAGICQGILPTWFELTRRIFNHCYSVNLDDKSFKIFFDKSSFSLDSLIQASLNKHLKDGGSEDSFSEVLQEHLYSDLLANADNYGIKKVIIKLFYSTKSFTKEEVISACDFFDKEYANSTILKLVKVLIEKQEDTRPPESIITFNADSLLYALLILYNIKINYDKTGNYKQVEKPYKQVIRPFEFWGDKIPIFHLHGAISPYNHDTYTKRDVKLRDGRNNLVFWESTYTQISGSMFSWAQSNFLYNSLSTSFVFLGLSMSDPNIRKWLSWTAENLNVQLEEFTGKKVNILKHLWIKPLPKEPYEKEFFETSLNHLSVKIGWIPNWNEFEESFKNIL
ncbi:MAG: SIR2 family protein [Cyclobacteriaceae bacterium]|nr:SIR2 family protein [Cyclobacteriaceae bacterium]